MSEPRDWDRALHAHARQIQEIGDLEQRVGEFARVLEDLVHVADSVRDRDWPPLQTQIQRARKLLEAP